MRDPIRELLFRDPPGTEECPWKPCADVYRTPDGWLVKMDLAGVSPDELGVSFDGEELTVSGVRRDMAAALESEPWRIEIAYAAFERRIALPCRPGECRIETSYRDGMLLVRVRTED